MHYIRLLRPPTLTPTQHSLSLRLVVTITTDLGESFLCPDQPIPLSVLLETDREVEDEEEEELDEKHPEAFATKTVRTRTRCFPLAVSAADKKNAKPSGKTATVAWTAGMRVLKLECTLPREAILSLADTADAAPHSRRLCVRAADPLVSASTCAQIYGDNKKEGKQGRGRQGLVVPVWVDIPDADAEFEHVSIRRFTANGDGDEKTTIEIEEEMGESIARHVWDGGLVSMGFFADLFENIHGKRQRGRGRLATAVHGVLTSGERLRVLELGSGVGILGIGLAQILHRFSRVHRHPNRDVKILLTDLPEAEERALANIQRAERGVSPAVNDDAEDLQTSPGLGLEYENLDWEDGCRGIFGPVATESQPWNLAMLSDCTYNVDMLPALVQTLSALQKTSPDVRVLLARKPRHASEELLFTLMEESGWTQLASEVKPLPVLYGERETLEMYLYGKTGK